MMEVTMAARALVGIPADLKEIGPHPYHLAGDKYVRAVSEGAGCLPLILPALGDWYEVDAVLDRLDGLFFTGSASNVHPGHYGAAVDAHSVPPHDPARDSTTLPLLRRAIARGLPLFCICRGFQELNVVQGGTLHPRVHVVAGLMDHREDKDAPVALQYAPAHAVTLTPGGRFAAITGRSRLMVNSVHGQGLDRLGTGLTVEARAPDGLVEAVSVTDHPFALGVQWHPEWRFQDDPAARALFAAFGDAVRAGAGT
jgi:putative glutamine amidotransferase